jgi:hypothetical protein
MHKSTLLLILGLAACGPQGTKAPERSDLEAEIITSVAGAAPKSSPGECWASDTTPAIIETITEQKLVAQEVRDEAGNLITPASYSTTVRQEMVQDRTEIWFRAPCPEVQTTEFIATLQRALKARGYFLLPLTGVTDTPTAEALRRFQAERGLDSPVLSLAAAQELGLISTALEDL